MLPVHSKKRPTIYIYTLGCKLNQAESEEIVQCFTESGCTMVSSPPADVCIVNTCTVTATADQKSRQQLRRLRRQCPGSIVVAAGCYSARAAEEIKAAGLADYVIGNADKKNLPILVLGRHKMALPLQYSGSFHPRTRSFVRIQDGCQVKCAYCVVPLVRPREVSVSPPDIVARIKSAVSLGVREVVLTGTRVGAYVSGNTRLAGLLARLLAETTIERIRLSSLQPGEIDENLLYLWENPRLCPHFHLALQSGSDRTLSAMGRRYDTAGFIHTLDLIRSTVPGAAITTDVMAGFPGETDLDFTASLQFCQEMDFAAIHAFSYSPRPGTAAANFKGQVPEHTRRQRLQALLRLSRASSRSYRQKFIGNTMPVLWENAPPQGGLITGLTPNYIRVEAAYLPAMENTLNMARLVSINGDNVAAEVIQAPRP